MATIGAFFYNNKKWYNSLNLSSEDSIQGAFNRQKKLILNSLPPKTQIQDREYLEWTLKSLLNGSNQNPEANKAQQAFQKNVQDIFTRLTNYNYESLDYQGQRELYKQGVRKTKTKVSEVNKLINQLYNILNQFSKGKVSQEEIIRYKRAIEDLKLFVSRQKAQGDISIDMSSFNNLSREVLNELLKTASLSRSDAKGQLFEIILAAASMHIQNTKKTNTKQILKKIKGKETSSILINLDNIDDELKETLFHNKEYQIDEYNRIKISTPTQDKLDVVFQWEGETLNVSAKSYSDIQRVHIASKFPLWKYILNDDGAFVNHWISLLTCASMKSYKKDYQNLMKYGLLVKSMVGTMKEKGQADTFIVQDTSTGNIYIRTMRELLEPLANQLDNINSFVHYSGGYPEQLKKVSTINEAFTHLRPITLIAELRLQNLLNSI